MGCGEAELALLLEALGDKVEEECGSSIPKPCYHVLRRVLNDLKEIGKEQVRVKYGL